MLDIPLRLGVVVLPFNQLAATPLAAPIERHAALAAFFVRAMLVFTFQLPDASVAQSCIGIGIRGLLPCQGLANTDKGRRADVSIGIGCTMRRLRQCTGDQNLFQSFFIEIVPGSLDFGSVAFQYLFGDAARLARPLFLWKPI